MKVIDLKKLLNKFDDNAEVTINCSYMSEDGFNSEFYNIIPDGGDQCGGEVYLRIEKH